MLKPRLLKSLIAQNAALLREQQGLMEYFRILEISLHVIEKTGKDSGVVQLQELANIRKDMRKILIAHRNMIFNTTGAIRPPTKKELGMLADPTKNSQHKFVEINEDLQNLLNQLMNDISNYHHSKDGFVDFGEDTHARDVEEDESESHIDPVNFGGDLEGEWQDFPPPPDGDPFRETGD
jgi:hypothetical protein